MLAGHQWQESTDKNDNIMMNSAGYAPIEICIARVDGAKRFFSKCCKGDGTSSGCDGTGTAMCAVRNRHTASGRPASRTHRDDAVVDRDGLADLGWIGQVSGDGRGGIGLIDHVSRCRGGDTAQVMPIACIGGAEGFCAWGCKGDGTMSNGNRASAALAAIRDRHAAAGRPTCRGHCGNTVVYRDRLADHGWTGQVRCDGRGGTGRVDHMGCRRGGGAAVEIGIARIRGGQGPGTMGRKDDGTGSGCGRAGTTVCTIRNRHVAGGRPAPRGNHAHAVVDGNRLAHQGWIGQVARDGRGGAGLIDRMRACRGGGTAGETRIAGIRSDKGFYTGDPKGDGTMPGSHRASAAFRATRDGHIAGGRSNCRWDRCNAVINGDRLAGHGWVGQVTRNGGGCGR